MPVTEFKKHPHDYLLLVAGVVLILAGFTLSWPREQWQRLFVLALGSYYSLWGIWHHAREKTLTVPTILEYLAISILVSAILWLALSY